MKEYIHRFNSETDYANYVNSAYTEPWVSTTYVGGSTSSVTVTYNLKELAEPLTFEIVSGGTLYWYNNGNTGDTKTIEYKLNDGEWTSITSSKDNDGSGTTIATVVTGDIIKFRGNNDRYCNQYSSRYNCFKNTSDCYFYAYGNIMSLINYDNFKTNKKLTGDSAFAWLFYNTWIMSHPEKKLLLPATTLAPHCYEKMFAGCYNLTTAPELPATTLQGYCYKTMFDGCVSLFTAPKLPATTLVGDCYTGMFNWCNSLVNAPELPATTLAQNCYYYMFNHCISLVNAPELPATTLANGCYYQMFGECTSLVNAPELPATTLADGCYRSMFDSCTSLTTAPELPATTLANKNNCYNGMFKGCTSLVNAPELPATNLAQSCYSNMFEGCTSLTKAPALPATTLVQTCYYRMFYQCTNLNYIKCLATNISAYWSINNWVNGVASSGTFVKDSSMTVDVENANWPRGISGIPNNWTVQDAS